MELMSDFGSETVKPLSLCGSDLVLVDCLKGGWVGVVVVAGVGGMGGWVGVAVVAGVGGMGGMGGVNQVEFVDE